LSFVLIYFSFSIFVADKEIVGLIGSTVATYSHKYIGYLSYVYLLVLLYPLYKFNFSTKQNDDNIIVKSMYYLFIFLILLILQALVISNEYRGEIGFIIIDSISPFIGLAGIWIFTIISMFTWVYVLFNQKNNFDDLFSFKINLPKNILPLKKTIDTKKPRSVKPKDKVLVKEVGNVAEITIVENTKEQIVKDDILEEVISVDITPEIKENEEVQEKIQEVIELEEEKIEDYSSIIVEELEENKKLLDDIDVGEVEKPKDFQLPPTNFFALPPTKKKNKVNEHLIDQKIKDLLEKLRQFKIEGDVIRTYAGPIVTTFEFKPAANVKVSKILNLQDDLAMALRATTIRIQAPIPGKDVVGIEVPNEELDTIYLREILESELFQNSSSPLTMILGKDIVGQPFITDLKKLPHLLIAGTTGSGKSVGINSMILSLLYKNSPDRLKLIMIDPKMLEFSMYNDIPHLLTPVITKPMEAINALANMVKEMEKRYSMMADTRTKNIENYNDKAKLNGYDEFPYVVIIIDELADLMMTSGKEVEMSVARLAQMARASGIHLIVATQRPSVDVVTGLIKANLPSRISYKVGQKIDSKIILDAMGAESLLGRGDMLFTPPGMSSLVRVHAPWSTEDEIDKVVDFLKEQREVQYDMSFVKEKTEIDMGEISTDIGDLDSLFEQAKLIVIQDQKSSISYIQRRLKIGYNRAATIVEQLEATGILSAANTKGNREILV